MKTFKQTVEHNKLNDLFVNAQYVCELYSYIKRNNIHQRKDKIRLFKMWFMSGREIAVNGSARGRVVLRYEPELQYLLKIGFIKQVRLNCPAWWKSISNNTILVLNDKWKENP